MNTKHIDAVLKGGSWGKRCFTLEDGTKLASNGYIALKWAEDFGARDYPPLGRLWKEALSVPVNPSPVGGMRGEIKINRELKLNGINEAFFRCFDGEGVTWTETGKVQMVCIHKDGELIGLVMPLKYCETLPRDSATDEQVFEEFACEANGYYLAGHSVIRKEIEKLEEDLEKAEEKAEDADAEVMRIGSELDSKREHLQLLEATVEVIR